MFNIEKFEINADSVVMELIYTIPIDGNVCKHEQIFTDKLSAMKMFASSVETMVNFRIDEFKCMLSEHVLPHYLDNSRVPYLGHHTKFTTAYWKFLDFKKQLDEMRYNPYKKCCTILDHFYYFEALIPELHFLKHQELNLIKLDIRTTAKQLKEAIEKIQKEHAKIFDYDNGI